MGVEHVIPTNPIAGHADAGSFRPKAAELSTNQPRLGPYEEPNSLALKEMGFTKKAPNPPGGVIHRDEKGEPNGILSESAFMGPPFFATPSIYSKMMGEYDAGGRVEMMSRCASRFHRLGIVGAHDPFVDAATLRTYQEAESAGKFPFRLYAFILNQWADPLLAAGIKRGFGNEWVKVGAIKDFLDGGMSSRTAAVSKAYEFPPVAGKGILNYDQKGMQVRIVTSTDEMVDLLAKGEVDLYFDSTYPATLISDAAGAKIILRRWRFGVEQYQGVIFASKTSGITSIDQLPGHMVAMDAPYSTSGFLLPSVHLLENGLTLTGKTNYEDPVADGETGFVFSYDDENTLQWVLSGFTDAGVTHDYNFDTAFPEEARAQLV